MELTRKGQDWAREHLPPGVRLLVGIVLMACGIVGVVIPVLGPWMLPLGIAVAALDVKPILHWWRGRVPRPFPDGEELETGERPRGS